MISHKKPLLRLFSAVQVLILFIAFSVESIPAEKNTPFTIVAGGAANFNFHSADFLNLSGMNRCCDNFQSGFGLGGNIFAGVEYKLNQKVFDFPVSLSLLGGYSNLFGQLKREEFIGNIIVGNTYTRGTSENTIDPKISTFYLEPSVVFAPIKKIPISFKLGLSGAIHSDIDYSSKETLTNPSDGTFENGRKVRAEVSSTQANSSGLLLSVLAGVRYELYRMGNFYVSPEIQYNFPLGDFSKDVKWTAHSLRAGVALAYTIPQTSPEPPAAAPAPKLPEPPPALEKPIATISLTADSKAVSANSPATVRVSTTKYFNDYSIKPVIYFKPNTTDEQTVTFVPNRQTEVFDSYLAKMKESGMDEKFKIVIGTATGEDANIGARRLEYVLSRIEKAGIDKDRVTHEIVEANPEKLRHAEMADELCFAKIVAGNGKELQNVAIEDRSKRKVEFAVPAFRVQMASKNSDDLAYSGEVTLGDRRVATIAGKETTFTLIDSDCRSISESNETKGLVRVSYKNKLDASSTAEYPFAVRTENLPAKEMHRFIEIEDFSIESRMFFLGFFDFDRSSFTSVNEYAIAEVKDALAKGQTVEIIPLHDKFGEPEYNAKLLASRANTAMKLIGSHERLVVKNPKEGSYMFDNDTPLGRILSRSVIVRILNK